MAKKLILLVLLCLTAFCIATIPQQALAFFPSFGGGGRRVNPEDDLYGILGINRGATEKEIKKAFRKVTKEEHPDLKQTAEEKEKATVKMQNVLRAYGVLSDPVKRKQFDAYGTIAGENGAPPAGHPNQHGGGGDGMPPGMPPEFAQFFRHFGGHQQRVHPIESVTPSLTLRQYVSDILPYRGRKLFLIQFYADRYASCKILSPVWEAMANNPMAQADAVKLFRVNIETEEGQKIVTQVFGSAGSMAMNVPTVMAVADGITWPMRDLGDFLNAAGGDTGRSTGKQQSMLSAALQGFVQSFYKDYEKELAYGTNSVEELKNFLTAAVVDPLDRKSSERMKAAASVPPVRVLISSNGDPDAAVGVGVSLDDPKVSVRIVHKLQDMIQLVTRVCHRPLGGVNVNEISSLVLLMNETIIENAFDADTSIGGAAPKESGNTHYKGRNSLNTNSRGGRNSNNNNNNDDSAHHPPMWCKKLFIAPLRNLWRPKLVLGFIRESFTKDSAVIKKKFPNAIPILRSAADFVGHCSPPSMQQQQQQSNGKHQRASSKQQQQFHHYTSEEDFRGKFCAIYVVNQCDGTRNSKGKGVTKTFMNPPLWATNRDRMKPFRLVGVCLDRQPRLAHALTASAGPRVASLIDKEDFIMMYDYSEPTRVGIYTHADIARGGGLPAFGLVLAAFLEDQLGQQPYTSLIRLAPKAYPTGLVDAFLAEPAHHVDTDNKAIYGHTITTHQLPPLTFPVSWPKWWAWRAFDGYKDTPFSSFIVIIVFYLLYQWVFRSGGGGGGVRNNREDYAAREAKNTNNANRNPQQQGQGQARPQPQPQATRPRTTTAAAGTSTTSNRGPVPQQQPASSRQQYTAGGSSSPTHSSSPSSPPSSPASPSAYSAAAIIRPLSLRADLQAAPGFLIVFIPRTGISARLFLRALDGLMLKHRAFMLNSREDNRFLMRQISPFTAASNPDDPNGNTALWQQWCTILESEAQGNGSRDDNNDDFDVAPDSPQANSNKFMFVMAIRAKKRLAVLKSASDPTSLDAWCEELADGTVSATKPLPKNFVL